MVRSAYERELLRQKCLTIWDEAKFLCREADMLRIRYQEASAKHRAQMARTEQVHARATEILERGRSFGPTLLEDLVDRTLETWSQEALHDKPTAVVASGDMTRLVELKALAASSIAQTFGVLDGGTALGLVIATQPTAAILDDDLEVAQALDVMRCLPVYGPQTKGLLLTDNTENADRVREAGFDSMVREAPARAILEWIAGAAA